VLRGAVRPPEPASGQVERPAAAAPDALYVIPRILDMHGMTAVVSTLKLTAGHTIYLTAYFAERRPPVQSLAAPWPRGVFVYTTALGQHRWRFDHEQYELNLARWLSRGKIRWCEPESNNERLSDDPPDRFPYAFAESASAINRPAASPQP
jgi:hypothetical protein